MLRSELEQAICNEAEVPDRYQTSSRGLGEKSLRYVSEKLSPWGHRFRHRRGRMPWKRKRIARFMGWEEKEYYNPFRKEKLEEIYDALSNRPDWDSWEGLLEWPQQA